MFQDFTVKSAPQDGPPRLALLRREMAAAGLAGFLVPRADAHQGEYVADCDARLSWLTGFTGSAGICVALADCAAVFIDGRYKVQVRSEVDLDSFTPIDWPATRPGDWIAKTLHSGGRIGFDPWLHTPRQIEEISAALDGQDITLVPCDNLVDAIWQDRPQPPTAPARLHPLALAGEESAHKRARIGAELAAKGLCGAVLTLPDSICWLLNIRGSDIARNPLVQCFAILASDGTATLFADPGKFDAALRAHLGPEVTLRPIEAFASALQELPGPVLVDPDSAPWQVMALINAAGSGIAAQADPCQLPKAIKNAAEIDGMRAAHLRDGAALAEFLAWLDAEAPKGGLSEIDVVRRLEDCRAATGKLIDISFDTICGSGPNGAIVHYRVSEKTNRAITPGEILLINSGAQYPDGTTDITRTIAIGPVPEAAKGPNTRVLKGMIALAQARWPKGLSGRDLDPLARAPLWAAGLDFDHGTGHGVGAALCVHEGPARISRSSDIALQPGMILSDEPGYYREGAFGIRIENLLLVCDAPALADSDPRPMACFETLTYVPIDRRLIDPALLTAQEQLWLNAYHAQVLERLRDQVSAATLRWLEQACAPL